MKSVLRRNRQGASGPGKKVDFDTYEKGKKEVREKRPFVQRGALVRRVTAKFGKGVIEKTTTDGRRKPGRGTGGKGCSLDINKQS